MWVARRSLKRALSEKLARNTATIVVSSSIRRSRGAGRFAAAVDARSPAARGRRAGRGSPLPPTAQVPSFWCRQTCALASDKDSFRNCNAHGDMLRRADASLELRLSRESQRHSTDITTTSALHRTWRLTSLQADVKSSGSAAGDQRSRSGRAIARACRTRSTEWTTASRRLLPVGNPVITDFDGPVITGLRGLSVRSGARRCTG
jgi:hypothetical protein